MQFLKWPFSGLEIIILVPCAKSVGLVESLLLGQTIDIYIYMQTSRGPCIEAQGALMFYNATVKYVP
jgi:hypothetical protein